jgi:lysyl-tRNA synthetase, class I
MFWVDRITEDIIKKHPNQEEFILRDEKTLSGQVHVGSLRGVVIHGIIAEALNLKGKKARFIYEFNDADPMDGMPAYLDKETYLPHMGKPLHDVPAPADREYNGMKATNLAEYFGLEFLEIIHRLGFEPEIPWAYKQYHEGFYDEWIHKVLEHPEKIREIYKRISKSDKPKEWMPLQVVCEKCGKIGSTIVTDFDGNLATYRCQPDAVEWAKGCGHEGKVEPWKGRGKIPWKVEWPVKWASYKVDIEGSGKDHNAASGSHDVGEAIIEEVLKEHVPYNIPYEFFLFEGAKMSSSKGNAASAKAITDLLPPAMFRFLMLMKKPNQPIEFSPDGETIPRLFDRYDEAASHYFAEESEEKDSDKARLFFYSQLDPESIQERFLPRFSKLIFWSQIPRVNVEEMVEKEKGSPLTDLDREEIKTRLHYINAWLEKHAPARYIYKILDEAPESAKELSPEQKKLLANLAEAIKDPELDGEAIHGEVHNLVKASGLKPKEAFPAIYQALLGKDFGPQVGWFIEALDREFVIKRFNEISS